MSSGPSNNDLLEVSVNKPLALLSVFVLALFIRALDESSFIKFVLILYLSFTILLSFMLLIFLRFLTFYTGFYSGGSLISNFQGCL